MFVEWYFLPYKDEIGDLEKYDLAAIGLTEHYSNVSQFSDCSSTVTAKLLLMLTGISLVSATLLLTGVKQDD